MNDFDAELYPRFTNLKSTTSGLKVFISVGGWAAGGAIFSEMVSSLFSRTIFIISATQFMATYGFDGIDIDWEYPAASDRDGVAADMANYVTFLKELKAACGSKYGVTVTLPSSYWYLKGFDIVSMSPYVDSFNFMSYDIHGTWDGNSPYTKSVIQPHTNLTEITEGLDLLWRNNIDPAKVVLGLGFYGRSFTLSDPTCTTPGCPFSGGGDQGECTQTSGILSNSEIQDIITKYDLTPVLDKEAAVKYIVWNTNQWVSYDDEETLELKRTFANNKCLGGRMVWALDLDNPDSHTSLANLITGGLSTIGDNVSVNPSYAISKLQATNVQNTVNLLAYWSDCSASPSCNDGFQLETLGHGKVYDADTNSYVGDGCHGGGNGYNRAFCVESDVVLRGCDWYGKPKGCSQGCPAGKILLTQNTHIGGASTGCKTGHYSSYCCDTIIANELTTCPASNAANLFTGGMGSNIELKNRQMYKDNDVVATLEYCRYLAGDFVNVLAGAYILNILAGTWKYRPLLGSYFSPLSNLVYKQPDPAKCTSFTVITTSFTVVEQPIQTNVCDFLQYPQACNHYSSVISRQPALDTLYCPVTTWGSRTLPKVWNSQHNSKWLPWVASITPAWGSKAANNKCERDEWPPARFMDKDEDIRYTQWMRFLPQRDNGGAGQLWRNKCQDRVQSHSTKQGGPINDRVCTEYESITYTVRGFSLQFTNTGQASGRIESNPCTPMILHDPGFALMNNDLWYDDNLLAQYTPHDYSQPPSDGLTSGVQMPRNPAGKNKRWLDQETMHNVDWRSLTDEVHQILSKRPPSYYLPTEKLHIDPEKILIDEGNSSRKATPKELWNAFGLFKCRLPGCPDERKAAGLWVDEEQSKALALPTSEIVSATTVTAGSFPSASLPLITIAPSRNALFEQSIITTLKPTTTRF
jgi:chitinase